MSLELGQRIFLGWVFVWNLPYQAGSRQHACESTNARLASQAPWMAGRWARKAHMARQKHKTHHTMKGTSDRYVPIRTLRRTVALSVVSFLFIIHMAICHVPNTINTLVTSISLMLFDCAPPQSTIIITQSRSQCPLAASPCRRWNSSRP
ncbi:uncharacterized protein LY79DRAFT_188568 [Colletotrichum navitas]|uniref:Uncharacterized protein n=1 Tax=Colletotrichum navitas TaxID=681940 RepID=A0AAD8V6B0_9PEZI|nr:uncharacterized protein LY79DRAFT_188568 [Colletotrichum navitas]KAK1593135.1 hypothetical protein LY79DRAFT_188568 [Colletotrichum navitas]